MGLLNTTTQKIALCTLAAIFVANPALAQDFSPVNTFLTTVGTALTTTTGRALGLIVVAGAGIMCFSGRLGLPPEKWSSLK